MDDDHLIVRNITQAYLNDNLEYQVKSILREDRKENLSRRFSDFMFDHPTAFVVCIISLCFILAVIVLTLGCFITYKIDIAKLSDQARICVDTGYGCVRNTTNTDIQYNNTPIVEFNTKEEK